MNRWCRIAAVGVVVPARDEQERIGACLRSVRAAIDKLANGITTAVTVVLDRCTDETPALVDELVRHWPAAAAVSIAASGVRRAVDAPGPGHGGRTIPSAGRIVVPGTRSVPTDLRSGRWSGAGGAPSVRQPHVVAGSGVGAVRDLGVRLTLERLRPHRLDATWLLHTDADTTVPPDWALAHLRHAGAGVCGVAGLADLSGGNRLSIAAQQQYHALVGDRLDGDRHMHVYGANLGMRADAYVAVGGFPKDGPGEDHGLWRRLDEAGYRLTCPTTEPVRTSARLHGRAAGGLADLLRSLDSARQE
ncbi:glycosyltransferase [Pseudonocardia alaniniphila]|uniref:Glycosyltransferase family 2 protein n=1 Tax=Pseudonocardia alaniniphila TaxID=75291 RepID=A0ABS9TR87_9PSEU|nr:glycosyltransferase family 2 protein [Pseudonocardia alaniniphila]MCH6170938.1 glycosyltransferase family 2 protein [Pseudonocardia alaniniphila]